MEHFLCDVERLKRFVNVRVHCIVSNLKKMSKISTYTLPQKFLRTPMWLTGRFQHRCYVYALPKKNNQNATVLPKTQTFRRLYSFMMSHCNWVLFELTFQRSQKRKYMVFTEARSDTGLSSYRLDKPQGAFIKALV